MKYIFFIREFKTFYKKFKVAFISSFEPSFH